MVVYSYVERQILNFSHQNDPSLDGWVYCDGLVFVLATPTTPQTSRRSSLMPAVAYLITVDYGACRIYFMWNITRIAHHILL